LTSVPGACTEFLTVMHTGGRSSDDIDAGDVPPGYRGTIVRDGYAGYAPLLDAHHAWCAAHLLRDLRAVHTADPEAQLGAQAMADTLTDAHHQATAARAAGHDTLDDTALAQIRNHYRGAAQLGIQANAARAGPHARDALRLARRFRDHETMILRFMVDLTVP
jgi:transposase